MIKKKTDHIIEDMQNPTVFNILKFKNITNTFIMKKIVNNKLNNIFNFSLAKNHDLDIFFQHNKIIKYFTVMVKMICAFFISIIGLIINFSVPPLIVKTFLKDVG